MEGISDSNIKAVVQRYSSHHVKDSEVIHVIIGYISKIPDEHISVELQSISYSVGYDWKILQYIYAANPSRPQFCVVMKDNYNIKMGKLCKLYNKITQILEGKLIINDVTDTLYSMSLHLNIFTNKFSNQILFRLLVNTNWSNVKQISNLKLNASIVVILNKKMWVTECKKAFQNVDNSLYPLATGDNNKCVEYIKIVHIHLNNIYVGDVGVSFELNTFNNNWSVQSIYLDCDAINNQYKLSEMRPDQLKKFNTNISKVVFIE